MVKNLPANTGGIGNRGSIPGSGRSPGEVKPTPISAWRTPWTVARQAPLSMGFSRQEYCSELPFPTPGDHSDPRIEPASPALAFGFFTTAPPGKP